MNISELIESYFRLCIGIDRVLLTNAVTRYVGRKHQPELLKRSVAQDCLPFMSRDHFNISFSRGLFHLRTMTSNPIWRFRSGAEPIELQRGDPVDLQTGLTRHENIMFA